MRVPDLVARVPARGVADAAKAAGAGPDVRLEHLVDGLTQRQVREADDAGRRPHRAVLAAGALRGHALYELGLAHRPERLGQIGVVHGHALDEHRGSDVVPLRIRDQLLEHVAALGPIPEMVVGVADL